MIRADSYTALFAKLRSSTIAPSEADLLAWNNPADRSYHSFHVEKLSADLFYVRDSAAEAFYICNCTELYEMLVENLRQRRLDLDYAERQTSAQVLRILSQEEVDDLLSDL